MKPKLNYNEIKGRRVLKPWGELAAGTGGVRYQITELPTCVTSSVLGSLGWLTGTH